MQTGGIRTSPPLRETVQGLGHKFIQLMETNHVARLAMTILVITAGILSIVSIIMFAGGQGLVLFFLIPSFIITALGLTMLLTDIASMIKNQKLQYIAEAIVAIATPFLLLGVAAALMTIATAASGGSALVFANPLFSFSMISTGLSLISLRKITFQFFFTHAQVQKLKLDQHKQQPDAEESTTPSLDTSSEQMPTYNVTCTPATTDPTESVTSILKHSSNAGNANEPLSEPTSISCQLSDQNGLSPEPDFNESLWPNSSFAQLHQYLSPFTTTANRNYATPTHAVQPFPLNDGMIATHLLDEKSKIKRVSQSAKKQRKESNEDKQEEQESHSDTQENQNENNKE